MLDRAGTRTGLSLGVAFYSIAATYLTGMVADRYSFAPILIVASMVPLVAAAAVVLPVRNTRATRDLLNEI